MSLPIPICIASSFFKVVIRNRLECLGLPLKEVIEYIVVWWIRPTPTTPTMNAGLSPSYSTSNHLPIKIPGKATKDGQMLRSLAIHMRNS